MMGRIVVGARLPSRTRRSHRYAVQEWRGRSSDGERRHAHGSRPRRNWQFSRPIRRQAFAVRTGGGPGPDRTMYRRPLVLKVMVPCRRWRAKACHVRTRSGRPVPSHSASQQRKAEVLSRRVSLGRNFKVQANLRCRCYRGLPGRCFDRLA